MDLRRDKATGTIKRVGMPYLGYTLYESVSKHSNVYNVHGAKFRAILFMLMNDIERGHHPESLFQYKALLHRDERFVPGIFECERISHIKQASNQS